MKFKKLLKGKKTDIIVCILLVLFFSPRFLFTCPVFSSTSFDSQALISWYYSSIKGMAPYRDIFYPYGPLTYFKDSNIIAHLLFELIAPTTFFITYLLFKRLFGQTLISIVVFIFFFTLTIFYNGDAFISYGFVAICSIYAALLFYENSLDNKKVFIIGCSLGIVFSLLHPQGFYLFAIFIAGMIVNQILKLKIKELPGNLLIYITGFIIGLTPFLLILKFLGLLTGFLEFYSKLSEVTLYAKTPFIPYSTSTPNLFTFFIFIILVFYLTFLIFFKKKNKDEFDYILITIFIVLVLFENISIIRSIDYLITFVPIITLVVFAAKLYRNKVLSSKSLLLGTILVVLTLASFLGRKPTLSLFKKKAETNPEACLEFNKSNFLTKQKSYKQVYEELIKNRAIVFSFPADPIFYIFLNQKMPYHSNNYDSSSVNSQNMQIQYMKDNNVSFIVYNTSTPSLQDNVPNYIRTPRELKYILNNFSPYLANRLFTLLSRDTDAFRKNNINKYPQFYNNLLIVDFQSIPYSESLYKSANLRKSKLVTQGNIEKVGSFLRENHILSKDKFLLIKGGKGKTNLSITSGDITTQVFFKSCKVNYCILNISNVPLFYKDRPIDKITSNQDVALKIVETNDPIYW